MRMLCPCCKTQLVAWEEKRIEDLIDHIRNPNGNGHIEITYICPNKKCYAFNTDQHLKHNSVVFWSEYGDLYGFRTNFEKHCISNNNAPFGTNARQMQVEIYKHDEDFIVLNLYYLKFKVIVGYASNKNGDILKRYYYIRILTREKHGGYSYYTSGISMLVFSLKQFYFHKKHNDVDQIKMNITRTWDKRWWYLLSVWYIKKFYAKQLGIATR